MNTKKKKARRIDDSQLCYFLRPFERIDDVGRLWHGHLSRFNIIGFLPLMLFSKQRNAGCDSVCKNRIVRWFQFPASIACRHQIPISLKLICSWIFNIDKLRNDRVGLVLFAGRAYLQMPLTSDHDAAKMYVSTASTASVPTQGTVIGEALQICTNAFDRQQKKFKAVVLVTDGEDHDASALEIARQMADDGVLLHTIGVGTATGANLIDPDTREMKRNEDGSAVVTRLNEKELNDLARTGNGSYQLLADTDEAVNRILAEIAGMEKKNIRDSSLLSYRSYFPWFLGLAALLLLAEMFYSERKTEAA